MKKKKKKKKKGGFLLGLGTIKIRPVSAINISNSWMGTLLDSKRKIFATMKGENARPKKYCLIVTIPCLKNSNKSFRDIYNSRVNSSFLTSSFHFRLKGNLTFQKSLNDIWIKDKSWSKLFLAFEKAKIMVLKNQYTIEAKRCFFIS